MAGFISEILREVQAGNGAGRGAVRQGETLADARQREVKELTQQGGKVARPPRAFVSRKGWIIVGLIVVGILLFGTRIKF